MLKVTKPFCGQGYNMPAPGTLITPPDDVAAYLVSIGVAERYETKIVEPPQEIKKKPKPSASSQAAPAPRKRTRRKSKKSVKKS
jgi:hypothetical protein